METSNIAVSSGNVTQPIVVKDNAEINAKQQNLDVKKQKVMEEKEVSPELEKKQAEKAVGEMNSFFQNESRKLSFSINKEADMLVIEVRDSETDKVLRQIPSEVLVKLAEQMNDLSEKSVAGMLLAEDV
ncbi:MAG: flagellar protein FlaG [Methylococcaceae bacterium]|nr:flagellar protein FlaG [Methylococcaceae bacterium]